jgi:hypothetical protein
MENFENAEMDYKKKRSCLFINKINYVPKKFSQCFKCLLLIKILQYNTFNQTTNPDPDAVS